MACVTEALLAIEKAFRTLCFDRLDPVGNAQHGYVIPGRLLIRDDSSILIPPDLYARQVRPYDEGILEELGGGSIYFCGNGEHLIEKMLEIKDLRSLDFGDSRSMNIGKIYGQCSERRIARSNVNPSRRIWLAARQRKTSPAAWFLSTRRTALRTQRILCANTGARRILTKPSSRRRPPDCAP